MSRSHEGHLCTTKVGVFQRRKGIVLMRRSGVVELGVVIGKNGRDISVSEAESYIAGYGGSFLCLLPKSSGSLVESRRKVD